MTSIANNITSTTQNTNVYARITWRLKNKKIVKSENVCVFNSIHINKYTYSISKCYYIRL